MAETAGLFCYCWELILGCKLRQEHKEEIRKHLSRVSSRIVHLMLKSPLSVSEMLIHSLSRLLCLVVQ